MSDFSDDDALAAEYVLGTLTLDERTEVERRSPRDMNLAVLIGEWERRLSPLSEAAPVLAPPQDLFARLVRRLPPETPAGESDSILIMRRRVRVWRGVAAIASSLAAVLALWIVGRDVVPSAAPAQTYVAVLQRGADQPTFVVSFDLVNRRMAVMPLAANAPEGKSYELWMIGADKAAPRSMGVINAGATLRANLPDVDQAVMSNATYAVTLEPAGGSPTGQPTSTPLFVGKPMNTSL